AGAGASASVRGGERVGAGNAAAPAASASARPPCTPFVFDEKGIKRYNPDCLE
ncbi:MAG: hypothetical protein JWP87_2923, partial [Labilithrix sp.]|nr:hypothetical protein [Labilithrix sp.]